MSKAPHGALAAVLWDMDGTLIDSEPHWMAAETDLVHAAGGVWTRADALAMVGNSLLVTGRALQQRGVPGTEAEIVDLLLDRVVEAVSVQPPWRPGALELLSAVASAGIPSALVTMSYRRFADAIVKAAPPGSFAAVVAGDEVERGKPDPQAYLRAAERLGVAPDRCVALEDSGTGIASAEAAGARAIAIPFLVDIPPAPGRSRVASLAELDVATLRRIVAGHTLDTVGAGAAQLAKPNRASTSSGTGGGVASKAGQ